MKICITLDDVLRNKTKQILKIYKKYVNKDFDEESADLSSGEMWKILGFENKDEYNRFLYADYVFEIFGEAEAVEKMLDKKLNLWLLTLTDYNEPVEIMLANPYEFNASIGFTHFFLSKMATRIRETYFPIDSKTIWDKCDVLVTSDPKLINNKPEGKILIKIDTDYNKELDSDFSYDSLASFISDSHIVGKLLGEDDEIDDLCLECDYETDAEDCEECDDESNNENEANIKEENND